jgi:sialic acid synthase SpsE
MTHSFDPNRKVFIVAEIGNNHEGSFHLAMEMVEAAAKTGVDAVKFQTFIPEFFVSNHDEARLQRLNKFKLTFDQFRNLKRRAGELGLIFFSTPLDIESAFFLNEIQPIFKISSGDNNFYPLIKAIASFNKPTIISSGIADLDFIKNLVNYWHSVGGCDENLAIMHCVSSYPAPQEQANLKAISTLKGTFPNLVIGYSDHTLGIRAAIFAVAAGARIIEKHFTLNKNQSDFRDHQLSADPGEMESLVLQVKEISELMGDGLKVLQPCEREMVQAMRRSIATARDLEAGDVITLEDIMWLRPGTGLPVGSENQVVGKRTLTSLSRGHLIQLKNLF